MLWIIALCMCVVYLCYPMSFPCLSVDNVSVSTMVPPTPTTQPIPSHPTTSTLFSPSLPPDPKGNTRLLRYLNYPPSFSPSFSALLWCLLIWWLSGGLHAHTHTDTQPFLLQPFFALHLHERTCLQVLGCAPDVQPTAHSVSLSLSYHWLFNVLHTHIVPSAFVCMCVLSWVGVLISGYWWWILIKSLKILGTLSDLSLLMLAAVGMVRCDTRTYTYPFTYTHLKKRKKGAGLSSLFFSCCCCLGKVETVHLPGMCRVWW